MFEYKQRIHPKHLDQEKMLNAMASKGWRLVCVDDDRFYFERPSTPPEPDTPAVCPKCGSSDGVDFGVTWYECFGCGHEWQDE